MAKYQSGSMFCQIFEALAMLVNKKAMAHVVLLIHLFPCLWKHISNIAPDSMITYKNKNGIIKIGFFFCRFNKFLKTKISISKSIQFFIAVKAIFFQCINRIFF